MNQGLFAAQINEAEKILDELGLYRDRYYRPIYNQYKASFFRGKNYLEIWQSCFDNQLYDFKLDDDSLIQFRANSFVPLDISYAYLECPFYKPVPFEKFVELQAVLGEDKDEFDLLREYDFYIATPQRKDAVTPIRYDYRPGLYMEGRHPASHVHFGHSNEIRLGAKKILRPLSFLFFVIRQCYPDIWIQFTQKDKAELLCRNIREHPDDIAKECWNKLDDWEMVLV
jgi:hypothetical protein